LFLTREKKEDRKRIINQITERVNLIERAETMPPLLIFPEGTATNGKALLQFKKGAFKDLKPIKIYAFKIPYN
jgi:1-acyl-sn-glycerol-3-phosphate acyltransferase